MYSVMASIVYTNHVVIVSCLLYAFATYFRWIIWIYIKALNVINLILVLVHHELNMHWWIFFSFRFCFNFLLSFNQFSLTILLFIQSILFLFIFYVVIVWLTKATKTIRILNCPNCNQLNDRKKIKTKKWNQEHKKKISKIEIFFYYYRKLFSFYIQLVLVFFVFGKL